MNKATSANCHCGSDKSIEACCQPIIDGQLSAQSAEQLMRSRYSAYVEEQADYLLGSWHADTRPSRISFQPGQKWLGLKIKHTEAGTAEDQWGKVEFLARFKIDGKGRRLHEISRFEQIDGRWYYLDGEHLP
jgi:SEC-C motif-containing protein